MAGKQQPAPAWHGVFLAGLARGMSVKGAARDAGVAAETAYAVRRRRPGFAAEWDAIKAGAAVRLASGAEPRLRADEVVRASGRGRPRIERAGPGRWSAGKEELFLATLAETANVRAACRAAGVSGAAVYRRRRDWPGFAERWAAVLKHGHSLVELSLIRAANATLGGCGGAGDAGDPADAGPALSRMTVGEAITVWKMHLHSVTGEGKRPRHDWRRTEPSIEEVRVEILRRVKAMGG